MTELLLLVGIILLACILMQRLTAKLPIPALLGFLVLGMVFGIDGLFRIDFADYVIAEKLCSVCLVFIMFYGGFGTNFKTARSVVKKSTVLAALGVVLTAFLNGCFIHFVLARPWLESMLIGSVISSTDAASVFNILRSRKLNLKDNTASLLEVESGSNDPMSYTLTVTFCALLGGQSVSLPLLLLRQFLFGIVFGVVFGKLAALLMGHEKLSMGENRTVFIFAVMLLSYGIPIMLGGNGYLSVYLCGVILGNAKIPGKRQLIHFYDTFTSISQIMVFFLLGLLVTPRELPGVFLPALLITLFLTFVARPVAVGSILYPMGTTHGQFALVSWAGLRGVASIVFAIMAALQGIQLQYNLFNLVYCVVVLSIVFQGSLLPFVARKLHMIDNTVDVYKTFNDYEEENEVSFIKIKITPEHPWAGHPLSTARLPKELLVTMIIRKDGNIIPTGRTVIREGDLLVIAAKSFVNYEHMLMQEITIHRGHRWVDQCVKDLPAGKGMLIVLIRRGNVSLVPKGNDIIKEDDILVAMRVSEHHEEPV